MGKYRRESREPRSKGKQLHPIWRGIGCVILVLVPILSFAIASLLMPLMLSRGLVPQQLLFTPQAPAWLWYTPPLAQAFQALFGHYAIFATLMLTVVFIILLGGVFSLVYAIMYQAVAPSRYGPLDAPPPKVKIKKYRR
jgi:hypothetical protein